MKMRMKIDINLSQARANLGAWSNRILTKLGNDVVANLQFANPVDTGFSRGRWIFQKPDQPFGVGLITNDAHYILYLDAGWSKQAPAGWVGASFQAAVRFLQ